MSFSQRLSATAHPCIRTRRHREQACASRLMPTSSPNSCSDIQRTDGIVPLPHGDALRATLPHSRLKVLERCGHLPMAEKPETFHRPLYDFLVGVEEEFPDVVQV